MGLRGAQTNGQGQQTGGRRARLEARKHALDLRKIPIFAGCSVAELEVVDRLTCEVRVPPGRVLMREGQRADQMLVVIDGRARVSRRGETLGTAATGSCFGGPELRVRAANRVTMTAETPMVLRAATARELGSLLQAVPLLELVAPPAIHLPVTAGQGRRPQPEPAGVATGAARTVVDEIEAFLRHEPVCQSDRVLAAVMFTDIVGSTLHLTTVGDGAWHTLLDAHDSIIEREVMRHGGTVVNFLGDGALARFECANSAVQCALAVRDAVRDLGIDMRAGLHVGEVERRGTDISGIAVHVASRICSVAGSGRVLASRTLVELVAGSGLVFEDAGTHALKGIGGEWSLLAAAG